MIICENNTVFAKSDFWSKTRQPALSPLVGKKQGWRLDEVDRHVQEIQMQDKRRNRTRPTLISLNLI